MQKFAFPCIRQYRIDMSYTLKDIAQKAGVSVSTVSRTLHDHYSISEQTKQKVRKVMEEMGYTDANRLEVRSIGVIFPKTSQDSLENPFYLESVQGIGKICLQQNFRIHLITGSNDAELEAAINISHAQGYIFLYSENSKHLITTMQKHKTPFVIIGKPSHSNNSSLYVDTDNVEAGKVATQYLLKYHHKRIGFIGAGSEAIFSIERKVGYMQALLQEQIESRPEYIFDTFEKEALLALMKNPEHPTAWVCCDDLIALKLEHLCHTCHLQIPEDISVIAFNHSLIGNQSIPPLTTIDIHAQQLGMEAANQLIKHIDNPYLFATKIIVPFSIIERESVKKPR